VTLRVTAAHLPCAPNPPMVPKNSGQRGCESGKSARRRAGKSDDSAGIKRRAPKGSAFFHSRRADRPSTAWAAQSPSAKGLVICAKAAVRLRESATPGSAIAHRPKLLPGGNSLLAPARKIRRPRFASFFCHGRRAENLRAVAEKFFFAPRFGGYWPLERRLSPLLGRSPQD